MANAPHSLNFKPKEQGTCDLSKKNYSRWFSSWMLLSTASSHSNQTNSENGVPVANHRSPELGFNRVNGLVYCMNLLGVFPVQLNHFSCQEWVRH